MAILDWEPTLWPEDLLTDPQRSAQSADARWWALHVRPRTEKMLARKLRVERVGYYLPLHERRKKYQRRVVTSHVPLFPGYLFAFGPESETQFLWDAREVANVLPVQEQDLLYSQLCDVRRLLDSGAPVTAEERLEAGMPARIVRGPLAGMSGRVVHNKRGMKFVLQVQFIQRAASIEIDGSMVEAV